MRIYEDGDGKKYCQCPQTAHPSYEDEEVTCNMNIFSLTLAATATVPVATLLLVLLGTILLLKALC